MVSDPLSLATRTVQLPPETGEDEVLVLPRIERVQAPGDGDDNRARSRGREVATAEVDMDGLRPLREGTSPRASTGPRSPAAPSRWSASSRGRATGGRSSCWTRAAPPTPEDLDAAVRAAASLTVHLARTGGCSLLLPGDKRPTAVDPTLAGWPHLHARLAVVPENGRPLLAGLTGRRGDVIYVSARMRSTPPAGMGTGCGRAHARRAARARRAPRVVLRGRVPRATRSSDRAPAADRAVGAGSP